ncbi:Carboxypeptidase regulatory-like domain protein [uncultured archaeon]|nr:Carboxypeptidase regulatory-like domain protein [uncultured archaeon]
MIGGIIAGYALEGYVKGAVWPEPHQLYVASVPGNVGVEKVTNLTFITFGDGAPVGRSNITLEGSVSAHGVTDEDGTLVIQVNAKSNDSIKVTAEKPGFRNATSFIAVTPGLDIISSHASITSGTATFVTFSVTAIGKPVSGAAVSLSGAGVALEGITNSNGQVIAQVNAPTTGSIIAAAKKPGYAQGSTAITSMSQQALSVSASQTAVTVNVPVFVTFTVTSGGAPIVDAQVSLSGPATGGGITNQDGRVIIQFTPQSTGTITVQASATGYASGSTTITSTASSVLSMASSPASITAGVPTYVQFTVTSGTSFISEANVTLSGAASGNGISNQNGQVILLVNATGAGSMTASASKMGYSGASVLVSATAQPALSVSESPDNITNGVATYVTLTVMSGNSPVSGAGVSVTGGGISADGLTNSAGQVTMLLNSVSAGAINVVVKKAGYMDGFSTLGH